MQKKCLLLILMLVVPMMFFCGFASPNNTEANSNFSSNENSAIIVLLSPYIEKAINEYYGDKVVYNYMGQPTARQMALYSASVDSINKVDNSLTYEIKVTVPTFHGAHISPYALEKMTFLVTLNTEPKLINYEHIPISN